MGHFEEQFTPKEDQTTTLAELKAYTTTDDALRSESSYFINFQNIQTEKCIAFEIVCDPSVEAADMHLQSLQTALPQNIRSSLYKSVTFSGGKSFEDYYRYFLIFKESDLKDENQKLPDLANAKPKIQHTINKHFVPLLTDLQEQAHESVNYYENAINFFKRNTFQIQGEGPLQSYPSIRESLLQNASWNNGSRMSNYNRQNYHQLCFVKKGTQSHNPNDDDESSNNSQKPETIVKYLLLTTVVLLGIRYLYKNKKSKHK